MDNSNPTAANPAAPEGNSLNIPVADGSADQATLDAHIDEVLGLPTQGAKPNDSATTGTDGDGATDSNADAGSAKGGADAGAAGGEATQGNDGKPADGREADKGTETGDKRPERKAAEKPVASGEATDRTPLTLAVTDKNGKEFTLKAGDNLDEVLADFDPKNNGQIVKLLDDFRQLNADQQAADAEAKTEADTQAAEANRQAQVQEWDNEITQLQADNRVPKPVAKVGTAAWKTDPAVVRVSEVFEFMTKENARRQAAGSNNFITSFEDALDKIERVELSKQVAAAAKTTTTAADATARAKASRVQGAGARSGNTTAPYRPGQYASIWDIPDN